MGKKETQLSIYSKLHTSTISSETCSFHSSCWTKQTGQIKINSWLAIQTYCQYHALSAIFHHFSNKECLHSRFNSTSRLVDW